MLAASPGLKKRLMDSRNGSRNNCVVGTVRYLFLQILMQINRKVAQKLYFPTKGRVAYLPHPLILDTK
jgi:hypothetical protein